MFLVSDLFNNDGVAKFPSLLSATPSFRKQFKPKVITNFFNSLVNIPLTWEDSVTSPNDLDALLLKELGNRPILIKGEVVESAYSENQKCFHIAVLEKQLNPKWQLMIGYATIDGECAVGNDWHAHAFLINEIGEIIEPTPMRRTQYYGVELSEAGLYKLESRIYGL
jgi:hypothetical protein